MTTLSVPDDFVAQVTTTDKGSMTLNNHADLILGNPARSTSGRALVVGSPAKTLTLNYNNDFTGGVVIPGQVKLPNLTAPPAGVATDRVVVDAQGNLYKLD